MGKKIRRENFCYNKIYNKVFISEKAMIDHNLSIHKGLDNTCEIIFQTESEVKTHVEAKHKVFLGTGTSDEFGIFYEYEYV